MLIPGSNGIHNQSPVDEAGHILITEAIEFITVSTGEELNTDRTIYVLVGDL